MWNSWTSVVPILAHGNSKTEMRKKKKQRKKASSNQWIWKKAKWERNKAVLKAFIARGEPSPGSLLPESEDELPHQPTVYLIHWSIGASWSFSLLLYSIIRYLHACTSSLTHPGVGVPVFDLPAVVVDSVVEVAGVETQSHPVTPPGRRVGTLVLVQVLAEVTCDW